MFQISIEIADMKPMKNKQRSMNLFLALLSLFLISCENQEITEIKLSLKKAQDRAREKALLTVKSGTIKRGQGFHQALRDLSVKRKNSMSVINGLRDYVEFSKLRVGDKLTATYDKDKKLIGFSYQQNAAEKHILLKNQETESWDYKYHEEKTEWITRILTGELKKDSTLQTDLIETGLKRSVVADIINVLLCKVNFRMNARMGDKYKVLLNERMFNGKILETEILYTAYSGFRAGRSEAFYYNDGEKKSTYTAHYTEEGEALIRSGLRYPLSRLHVRSRYGMRRHPVTGRRTMHRGVDLRGRRGAPVHAVARGLVVESLYNPFAGNRVAIRHADRSISYYMHLKNRAVKKGDRVLAHQIIGRVGKTGRVTGPHLHFGFKNSKGRWMNPLSKRMIATPKLKGERYTKLTKQIEQTKSLIRNIEIDKLSRYIASPDDSNS